MDLELNGRHVFVAGASRGIGEGIVRGFLGEGAKVSLAARTPDPLEATRASLAGEFGKDKVWAQAGDMTDTAAIVKALADSEAAMGPIHVAIANVGIDAAPLGLDLDDDVWASGIGQNFLSGARLAREWLKRAIARPAAEREGANLILISSIAGLGAIGTPLSYGAMKAAINHLAKEMARAAGREGIRVNAVAPGNIVFPGGSKPITGNNPIAVGMPSAEPFPFMLDISMSSVSGGKLLLASKKKEKIPLDWATDRNGRFTDDPDVGFKGFLQPLGGHKGYGLSLVVDLLCGVISGGAFQFDIAGMYTSPDKPSLTGHMMIAIDPTIVMGRDALLQRMRAFHATIKGSPMWEDGREMLLPGELEHRTRLRRERDGIPIPAALFQELTDLGRAHGVETRLEDGRSVASSY